SGAGRQYAACQGWYGVSEADTISDVDLRQHRLWCALIRKPAERRNGRARRMGSQQGSLVDGSQGQAPQERFVAVGWATATFVYRTRCGSEAGSIAARRTYFGA